MERKTHPKTVPKNDPRVGTILGGSGVPNPPSQNWVGWSDPLVLEEPGPRRVTPLSGLGPSSGCEDWGRSAAGFPARRGPKNGLAARRVIG